jgi:hypothetical protein
MYEGISYLVKFGRCPSHYSSISPTIAIILTTIPPDSERKENVSQRVIEKTSLALCPNQDSSSFGSRPHNGLLGVPNSAAVVL